MSGLATKGKDLFMFACCKLRRFKRREIFIREFAAIAMDTAPLRILPIFAKAFYVFYFNSGQRLTVCA